MFVLVIMLGATAATFLSTVFYIPLVLKITAVLVFIGISFVMLNNQTKLAYWKSEGETKNNELNAMINGAQDGIVIYDANFQITSFNKAAETIFNINTNEILGKFLTPEMAKDPKIKIFAQIMFPSLAPQAIQISKGAWPQIVDFIFDSPQLRLRTVLSEIKKDNGTTMGFIKIIQDKTREKNILASKDEFITIAAHQLRTPLTAIKWGLEYISQNTNKDNQELRSVVKEEEQLIERSLKIINDLLDVVKIEEGKFGYSFVEIGINEFIAGVVNEALPVAKSYNINLVFEPKAEESVVYVDVKKIGIALVNLIDNAIKYNTKQGVARVKTEISPDKMFVKIKIEDTGVGIPKNETIKIFTKFYRGSNIVQLEPNGSGLGLYLAKNIIERHGGQIGFDSIENRGTTFWFTLPLNKNLIPPQELMNL